MYKASTRDKTHNSKRESVNKARELFIDIFKKQCRAKSNSQRANALETCLISRGSTKLSPLSLLFLLEIPSAVRGNGRKLQQAWS